MSAARARSAPQTAGVDILRAVADPLLLGKGFKNPKSWAAWRSFLATMFGLPMTPEQLATFQACTGRTAPPEGGATSAFLVCGRRGGKSFVLSAIAVYLAAFRDWRPYLQPSERATIMIVAGDRRQARVIMRFVSGLLNESPVLKQLIESEIKESISLQNQVTIEIHTSSMKSTRGYTIACALLDELAFWNSETTTEPDTEIIAAIKPGIRSPARSCSAPALRMRAAARYGTHTGNISAKRVIRCSSGKRRRAS